MYKTWQDLSNRQRYRRLKTAVENIVNTSGNSPKTLTDVIHYNNEPSSVSLLECPLNEQLHLEIIPNHEFCNTENLESNNNSDFSDEDDVVFSCDIKSDLIDWALQFNVNQHCLSTLLKILKKYGHNLPADARTLLSTPKKIPTVKSIDPGNYCHIGIKNGIVDTLSKNIIPNIPPTISLNINIDGLPLTKSTNRQLWPILANIHGIKSSPFIIGIYHGEKKPVNVNAFLEDFVKEYVDLKRNGLNFQNVQIEINIRAFICDAPAKSFITLTKGHNAYFGCGKCITEGDYIDNRMSFRETGALLRKDDDFLRKIQNEHHRGVSILEKLPIGMVTSFPLDYMHLVCLGVTKKLINLWITGKFLGRLNSQQISQISTRLLSLQNQVSREFCRKPRGLGEVDKWKATEFRQFLIYSGMYVTKGVLKEEIYTHFLTLCCSIRVLLSPTFCNKYISYAKELLNYFVNVFPTLYGKAQVSYNVHNLIHLTDDVNRYGVLDTFSAFPFENFMKDIKRMLRKHEKPLEQIYNRVQETRNLKKTMQFTVGDCFIPKRPFEASGNQLQTAYKSFTYKHFYYYGNSADDCILLKNGTYFLFQYVLTDLAYQETYIMGKKFKNTNPYFENPCNSELVGIHVCSNLGKDLVSVSLEEIEHKCFKILMTDNTYLVLPLLHQISDSF